MKKIQVSSSRCKHKFNFENDACHIIQVNPRLDKQKKYIFYTDDYWARVTFTSHKHMYYYYDSPKYDDGYVGVFSDYVLTYR